MRAAVIHKHAKTAGDADRDLVALLVGVFAANVVPGDFMDTEDPPVCKREIATKLNGNQRTAEVAEILEPQQISAADDVSRRMFYHWRGGAAGLAGPGTIVVLVG